MNKTKDSIKAMLREQWEKACNGYLLELLRMWELDAHYGYWIGDEVGGVYDYGEGSIDIGMDNIIYCVENDVTRQTFDEWAEYICDASEFGFDTPNLGSWCKGCPRTPQKVFDRLRGLKADLAKAVEEEKERQKAPMNPNLDKRLIDCGLSVRTINLCYKNDIKTVGDLVKLHKTDFLKFRNAGRKSLCEVEDLLEQLGLDFTPY